MRNWINSAAKIIKPGQLSQIINNIAQLKRTVAFTNGCFDILHQGHVECLEKASGYADVLIVGVNSDASVRALKGDKRPINPAAERMHVLAGLQSVCHVVEMDSLRCTTLLLAIRPNVWVKGGDYTKDTLNEEEVIAASEVGARIVIVPITFQQSTTNILSKI